MVSVLLEWMIVHAVWNGGEAVMKEYIVQAIAQETIDSFDAHNAPELIRCKDCKWNSGTENFPYCQILSAGREQNWFCADGKHRET